MDRDLYVAKRRAAGWTNDAEAPLCKRNRDEKMFPQSEDKCMPHQQPMSSENLQFTSMEVDQKQIQQNTQQPGEKQQNTNYFVSDFDPKWAGPSTAQTWRAYNDTLRLCSIEPNRWQYLLLRPP
ncbi:hypothetical protein WR25_05410 [Diploscapter pachys]|uniref:Uncharacterized protein n=1 Tax=Diploscapter pachys TaxID=2018661 RepID=A0A2A2K9X8_9BILA|nr:hypothetical protein WR25_05410 [Diploscapter pachys]